MATCKDCLHFEVCEQWYTDDVLSEHNAENDCDNFKDPKRYVVRENGEWLAVEESKDSDGFPMQRKCLCCGKRQLWMNAVTYNFCPNCGADMRKGENG